MAGGVRLDCRALCVLYTLTYTGACAHLAGPQALGLLRTGLAPLCDCVRAVWLSLSALCGGVTLTADRMGTLHINATDSLRPRSDLISFCASSTTVSVCGATAFCRASVIAGSQMTIAVMSSR